MQNEAIAESVRILREHERATTGGSPLGQARGKIILPCGTGKTRISLRIVEELTAPGQVSIVLCPSIALVAQIRREYLQHTEREIRALAVCSDATAGYDPRAEGKKDWTVDPTVDTGNVSADEVKGMVTTDAEEIAEWIKQGNIHNRISVIFGTYQSGHRIAEALRNTCTTARVLIADEAHRTAGLRKKKGKAAVKHEQRLKDFTLCHDNDAFPAVYRVYQTATPRIYDTSKVTSDKPSDYVVRSMDDVETFGVELYRKSYVEAVNNEWLSDYRIIAVGINDAEAYGIADRLARNTESKGRQKLTSTHYLRGLAFALAMAGGTKNNEVGDVPIKSCIGFMNTVDKSRNMAKDLTTPFVKEWLRNRMDEKPADFRFDHLDASSNVTARDEAKRKLANATDDNPFGVLNVGIFGEGTDSPSLSAVAFLEARKSPIDVIQAVGRAMRTAPGKKVGYIICPILIPPNADPEQWLSTSEMDEGWQELGQILLALRAHDQRIEDELSDLMHLYLPEAPKEEHTIIAVGKRDTKTIQYGIHKGPRGEAQKVTERIAKGESTRARENIATIRDDGSQFDESDEPTQIITSKTNEDGTVESRIDTIARGKPKPDGTRGAIDVKKSKTKAKKMINDGDGVLLKPTGKRKPKTPEKPENGEPKIPAKQLMFMRLTEEANAIAMNLLWKSGLVHNRVIRDLNILESTVKEAALHLRFDGLQSDLDEHFGLNNLKKSDLNKQADGCTIASLLMMNAAMLHQRISNGKWLTGVPALSSVKNDVNVVRSTLRAWERIMRHDFEPVLEPAVEAIDTIDASGKTAGLERALIHITAEAERIAETYADMGADHAGPLFNRVMGNQASDGAFFTRPVAASIAARLTLDALGERDWAKPKVWREHKTVDLACGSGTLLAAMLTEMKRRARVQGADEGLIAQLQKIAVEDVIKGMDINPVSLQLAASQLTTGNQNIRYLRMGLRRMPYGPDVNDRSKVSAGSLELLGQRAIVSRQGEMEIPDERIASQTVWQSENAEMEDAVKAAKDARIVIMNPPFTNRTNMGQKFSKDDQQRLRTRVDLMEKILVDNDPEMNNFVDKNSVRPLFVALADRCLGKSRGGDTTVLINPTIALTAPSGQQERVLLAERFHIHTIVTCHQPKQINLSQNTNINESIIMLQRHVGPKPPTRFIQLDKFPANEDDVDDLHGNLIDCSQGSINNGWGMVSYWPADRIEASDWTPAIWRSAELAKAASDFGDHSELHALHQFNGVVVNRTGDRIRSLFEKTNTHVSGTLPVLGSKGAEGQKTVRSTPDEHWVPKERNKGISRLNEHIHPEDDSLMTKAGHLLITFGQDNSTARVTATADDKTYVGSGWMPVTGISPDEAKAAAVFINSTPGRSQLMRKAGRKLSFPSYSVQEISNIRIPDVKDDRIRSILADCWERTKDMVVPQFRDGECEVRRLWDEAVAEAMDWDADELSRLRHLLHREPHVSGLGYNQYADEVED